MLLGFTYAALAIFAIGVIYRGWKIAKMPVHLRWELAPVPHEKGKSRYGGSYFEEYEWWTKPREKSLLNEVWYMFLEIVFLRGVWEHKRPLWFFTFSFHFGGLYLPAASVGMMLLSSIPGFSLLGRWAVSLLGPGYLLGALGIGGLLYRRATDPEVKAFGSFATFFNLFFLLFIYLSGIYAMLPIEAFAGQITGFVKSLLFFNLNYTLSMPARIHVCSACLFLIYLPFTYMMHFVAKYFTYHEIRWNDKPMQRGSNMEKEVQSMLGQKVSWSAPHIMGEGKKTWVDAATEDVKK